jgi:FAD/FMN-containing dehydrogenase
LVPRRRRVVKEGVTRESTESVVDAAEVAELGSAFGGELVRPEDAGYEEARAVWNGLITKRPALIARCASRADAAAALAFARDRGLPVSVRGGGHGVAGTALTEGGLVIDLSLLRTVEVDTERRTAKAGGGVTLGELDAATQSFGLAVPVGVVSETGIAGLTLGGGIGWLRRKHGLSCDNLVSAEVVTGDGRLVTASEDENPDLLWGLRGGGGSLGVVTSFEYRLHPVGPEVMVGFVLYPAERAPEVLRFCDEHTKTGSEELSPLGFLGRVPPADPFPAADHGRPYVALLAVYAGDAAEGERVVAPLRALGDPIVDLSDRMPYTEAQRILDEDYPNGGRYYWKSIDLDRLDDEAVARSVEHAAAAPSEHSTVDLWFNGGAMGRVDAAATAFGERPAYLVGVEANWHEGDDAANIAWARSTVDALRGFSRGGGYLNFPGFFEEGEEQLRASYGATNLDRLVELGRTYDPGGLLTMPGAGAA